MIYCVGFGKGYLLNHIVDYCKNNRRFLNVTNNIRFVKDAMKEYNISEVWDFACPGGDFSENPRYFKDRIFTTLKDTKKLIKWCNDREITLIYASSEGVEDCETLNVYQKIYNTSKFLNEEMIKTYCKKYRILRIPRVYSKDRNKGLIKALKEEKVYDPLNIEVEFIDLQDFLKQTFDKIEDDKKQFHYTTEKQTMEEIRNRYVYN